MKAARLSIILGAVAVVASANAQVSLTTTTYSEDFNSLPSATVASYWSATVGVQKTVTGSGWVGTKTSGTSTSGASFEYGTGTANSGSIHNVGSGPSDRALGLLGSGSNVMSIGVQITNNTGSALSSIDLRFSREVWRSSTSLLNTMVFSYARSSTSTATGADFLTSTNNFSNASSLDLVGLPPVTTNGALDGNGNAEVISDSITFSTPLGVGESLFLRWSDTNDTGNDALIAIDDFSVTAHPVPEPATMAVLGLGAAALIRRRKK